MPRRNGNRKKKLNRPNPAEPSSLSPSLPTNSSPTSFQKVSEEEVTQDPVPMMQDSQDTFSPASKAEQSTEHAKSDLPQGEPSPSQPTQNDAQSSSAEQQPQPPSAEEKAKAQALAALNKVSSEMDTLSNQLFALPAKVIDHVVKMAAQLWKERRLASDFDRHSDAASSDVLSHAYIATLQNRTQTAFSLRREFGTLQYQSAGFGEMFLQKIFSLDCVQGEGIRPLRKQQVLRAKAMIRRADQIRARVDKLEQLHNTLDALLAKASNTANKLQGQIASASAPNSPHSEVDMDEDRPTDSAVSKSDASNAASAMKLDTPASPTSEERPLPSKATASTPAASAMDADTQSEQDEANEAEAEEDEAENEDPEKAIFFQAKQHLERYRPVFREEELPRAIRIIGQITGVPRDRLWVEVNHKDRTLKIQGVRYAAARRQAPADLFGFGLYPFGRPHYEVKPEPVAWFETIFEIPANLDLKQVKMIHEGPNLVLTLPKVIPPRPAQPRRPSASAYQVPPQYQQPPINASQYQRRRAPMPAAQPRYSTVPYGFTDFPTFGSPFTPFF